MKKAVIHARLDPADQTLVAAIKRATGWSDTEVLRRGLRLVHADVSRARSALETAAASAGKFAGGPKTLSTARSHLEGFGR